MFFNTIRLKTSEIKNLQQNATGFLSVPLIAINDTYYSVTLDFNPTENAEIVYRIYIGDKSGNYFSNAEPIRFIWEKKLGVIALEDMIILLTIIIVIFSVFSFILIKKFRKSKLVGLDTDLVMSKVPSITEIEIQEKIDFYTLGILVGLDVELVMDHVKSLKERDVVEKMNTNIPGLIVSFFDQRHCPIPILEKPPFLRIIIQCYWN